VIARALAEALGATPAWLVGGAVRDRLLGRATPDLDVAVDGDPAPVAQRLARAPGGTAFELSETFGAWRVVGRGRRWQADLTRLQGATIEADLAARDFTVNAMAEPVGGGDLVDPHGGRADLAGLRLRMVAPGAFAADPLRVVRLARLAVELGFEAEPGTAAAARDQAPALAGVAPERLFAELKRIVVADAAPGGLQLLESLDAMPVLLPELDALHGVQQNRYHHRDVHGHTMEVLERVIALERDPGAVLGDEALAAPTRALLSEPLADDLTRGGALRLGALLHDAAKPQTRVELPGGRVGFPGHDAEGAALARAALTRLRASERLRAHVAALARHHLRLGFLVHGAPLDRRALYAYLVACEPVEADVTLLSVADRLATRGRKADEAIARHLALARLVLAEALARRARGPQPPLVRGDELAREVGLPLGRELGALLAAIETARFAGEIATREEAIAFARAHVPRARRGAANG
jgi:poly(A) polymerase